MKLFYQQHSHFHFDYHTDSPDFPPHIQNAVEILFLLEGECVAHCDGEKFLMRAGDVFISFPNQVHAFQNAKDARYYLLILPAKPTLEPYTHFFLRGFPESAKIAAGVWEHTGILPLLRLAHSEAEEALPEVKEAYMQLIFGKLLPLLSLREKKTKKEGALRAVLEYVTEHYRENISRTGIAKALGYHENYVSHVFSEALKTTLPEYINALRTHDGAELLLQKELTISDIALEVGFGSIRNFNRAFGREFGMSPAAYRKGRGK